MSAVVAEAVRWRMQAHPPSRRPQLRTSLFRALIDPIGNLLDLFGGEWILLEWHSRFLAAIDNMYQFAFGRFSCDKNGTLFAPGNHAGIRVKPDAFLRFLLSVASDAARIEDGLDVRKGEHAVVDGSCRRCDHGVVFSATRRYYDQRQCAKYE